MEIWLIAGVLMAAALLVAGRAIYFGRQMNALLVEARALRAEAAIIRAMSEAAVKRLEDAGQVRSR